jgi:hypothetical protein
VPLAAWAGVAGGLIWRSGPGSVGVRDPAGQGVGDLVIRTGCRVLVDQRGACAVVSHPRLEIGQAGACLRGKGISRMTEIMKVQAGDASAGNSRRPADITAEVAVQHPAECSGEDQRRMVLIDVGVQVPGEGLSDRGRDGNGQEASAGL